MKHFSTLVAGILLVSGVNAQSFSDDFESYTTGSYLGATSSNWTTWSGNTGNSSDVKITDTKAHSGTKSIYFSSTSANGGPQDVILPFGGQHDKGLFVFETWIYVEKNKGAYFNMQANTTPGQLWALDYHFVNDGNLLLRRAGVDLIKTTYTSDKWFKLTMNIDLSTNTWELLIDGTSQGKFFNEVNKIASLDIFPTNGTSVGGNNQAGFYIDDISYKLTPHTALTTNGAVTAILDIDRIAGQEAKPKVRIRNLGTTAIKSYDLKVKYKGATITESVSNVNVATYATHEYKLNGKFKVAPGQEVIEATISNVNGAGADDKASDDSKTAKIDPLVPAEGKIVIVEEGTGTWCGFCPRGAVALENLTKKYEGFFQGIAVHNGDPMTVSAYDGALSSKVSGYPSALVDRGASMDPGQIEPTVKQRLLTQPFATVVNGAEYNKTTRELKVSLSVNIKKDINANWKLACVLTEDGVTGTGSGYNQSNYYAGGSRGPMGGYETLPNPVPAAQMVYDHVARAISPSFNGATSFQTHNKAGKALTVHFKFTLDQNWDDKKIHIVGILIDDKGRVDNGSSTTIDKALINGFKNEGLSDFVSSVRQLEAPARTKAVFPNPSSGTSFLPVNLETEKEVVINLYNIEGKLVAQRNYGQLIGTYNLPINTQNLSKGIYMVQISIGGKQTLQKLNVQ